MWKVRHTKNILFVNMSAMVRVILDDVKPFETAKKQPPKKKNLDVHKSRGGRDLLTCPPKGCVLSNYLDRSPLVQVEESSV